MSDWVLYNLWFEGVAGDDSVWVGWNFESDGDADRAEGAWIDNLEVWRYNTPAQTCGSLDPGAKGVVVNPYEWVGAAEYPIIRAGDTMVVDGLVATNADWVRMVFQQKGGLVDQQAYDRMVDTLCAYGIGVLGVVNHETLVRQDFDNEGTAEAYRQEFADTVGFLADRFEGRITYWEVWNEENYDSDPGPEKGPPWVDPRRYAPLLDAAYQSIKAANPAAQVGGMGWKGRVPAGGLWPLQNDVPGWFGLYQGDKRTPNPARCAFAAYPAECHQVFVPVVFRAYAVGAAR